MIYKQLRSMSSILKVTRKFAQSYLLKNTWGTHYFLNKEMSLTRNKFRVLKCFTSAQIYEMYQ